VSPQWPVCSLASSRIDLFAALVPWLAALAGVVIVGGVIAMLVRKWMQPAQPGNGPAMTLEDLRTLHRSGALSDDEFAAAKAALIAAWRPSQADARGDDDLTANSNGRRNDLPDDGPTEQSERSS
jgi:hypothetical protein